MPRTVSWYSAGAASAVATKLSSPDVIALCDTGAEHPDNKRFMVDCENWFDQKVTILKNTKYEDTWDVWEKKKFLSSPYGAPCTMALKIQPRLDFQLPDDIHIFGYTADRLDVKRADALREHYPELTTVYPLIERGLTKAACLAMIENAGFKPPLTYAEWGMPNANCVPCVKATSPDYWSMIRKHAPDKFERMVELSRRLNVRLARINNERIFIDEIPADWPTTKPLQPDCDFLCHLAEQDMSPIEQNQEQDQ